MMESICFRSCPGQFEDLLGFFRLNLNLVFLLKLLKFFCCCRIKLLFFGYAFHWSLRFEHHQRLFSLLAELKIEARPGFEKIRNKPKTRWKMQWDSIDVSSAIYGSNFRSC